MTTTSMVTASRRWTGERVIIASGLIVGVVLGMAGNIPPERL